jgi:hypothetical protein
MLRLLCITLLLGSVALAEAALPIDVEVTLAERSRRVAGKLTAFDEIGLTLSTRDGERQLSWTDLTPNSAFGVRARLIDRNDAADWLELGRFGWSINARDQARGALSNAMRIDRSVKPQVDEILASPAGSRVAPAAPPASQDEMLTPEDAPATPGAPRSRPARPGTSDAPSDGAVVKFLPASPEEHALAIERARARAAAVSQQLGIKLEEIQTEHFILFTDWDPREFNFLRENVEGAYTLVSKEFDLSPKDNIFVGKLPVFMFARHSDFRRFAVEIDRFDMPEGVQGYYQNRRDGMGHMAMPKPDLAGAGGNVRQAELQWAYILTHEFVHAFVARYRTNGRIPRWLNEGTAELIAESKFRRPDARRLARMIANGNRSISNVFDDRVMPGGEYYPVMMTLVEVLVVEDRRKFIEFFNACKDGEAPEAALKRLYGVDYAGLEDAWRRYARRL